MAASFNYYTKKAHRYLGVFIGLQFLLWTVGGLYFSWTNIREIRGEHLRKEASTLPASSDLISPSTAIEEISSSGRIAHIHRLQLISVFERPFYEIVYMTPDGSTETVLADGMTGSIREDIDENEAVKIATESLVDPSKMLDVSLLKEGDVGGHHEYREKPLPAYAVTFAEPADLVVYVSKKTGRVESYRTNAWRVFDFLWLFHTLDLYGRDNINNYVLRIFSILGLVTIFSGYLLFFITSPTFRRGNNGRSK